MPERNDHHYGSIAPMNRTQALIQHDQDKLRLFREYGYDILRSRKFIIAKAGIKTGSVLEIGTGRGHMAIALAQKGIQLISIDRDKTVQKIARAMLTAMKLAERVTLKHMNAEQLIFKAGSFDWVVSVNFMHHAKDPERCIQEMVRVAKNSVVIADLNRRGAAIMDAIHRQDGHQHEQSRISLKEIKACLIKNKLSVTVYRDTCQTVFVAKKQ